MSPPISSNTLFPLFQMTGSPSLHGSILHGLHPLQIPTVVWLIESDILFKLEKIYSVQQCRWAPIDLHEQPIIWSFRTRTVACSRALEALLLIVFWLNRRTWRWQDWLQATGWETSSSRRSNWEAALWRCGAMSASPGPLGTQCCCSFRRTTKSSAQRQCLGCFLSFCRHAVIPLS